MSDEASAIEKQLRDAVRAGDIEGLRRAVAAVENAAAAVAGDAAAGAGEGEHVLPDIDARDDLRRTALHLAAWRGDAAATDILLAAGARADRTAQDSYSPLHFAANGGHAVVCDCLLRRYPKIIDLKIGKNNRTALHLAASRNSLAAVQVLLRHGADPMALTKSKQTAADLATDKAVIDALVSFSQRKLARAEKELQRKRSKQSGEEGEGEEDDATATGSSSGGARIEPSAAIVPSAFPSSSSIAASLSGAESEVVVPLNSSASASAASNNGGGGGGGMVGRVAPKRKLQQVFAAAFADEEDEEGS